MRRELVLLLSALALAGCAATQAGETRATEQLLAAAGFQVKAADTPQKLAHLQALAPRKVLLRPQNGEPYYVYADPSVCRCLYAGTEQQYREYQRLAAQKAIGDEESRTGDESWDAVDFWGVWPLP